MPNSPSHHGLSYTDLGYSKSEGDFTVKGAEIEPTVTPIESLIIDANYTFTENRDKVSLRIPKHKVNAGIQYELLKKTNFGLQYQFTGKRLDIQYNPDFTSENVELDAFSLLNFNVNHQFSNKFTVFLNLDNIFNEEYAVLVGYTTRGRNIRVGFRLGL